MGRNITNKCKPRETRGLDLQMTKIKSVQEMLNEKKKGRVWESRISHHEDLKVLSVYAPNNIA